jgi:hypothetical protein
MGSVTARVYRHVESCYPHPCSWLAWLTPEEKAALSWAPDPHCRGFSGEQCAKACYLKRMFARDAEAERRRTTSPRRFPMPTGGDRAKRGHCSWCGEVILVRKLGIAEVSLRRGWHDGRDGEPNCLHQLKLHTDREVQVNHVLARDGVGCCDCGQPEGRWTQGGYPSDPDKLRAWGPKWERWYPAEIWVGEFAMVSWSTRLELEHETPLWSVAHLPDEERRPYFGPDNLKLRCRRCHAVKTKREAGDRAKGDRLKAGPKERKGRAIPARADGGWSKRPMAKPTKKTPRAKAKTKPAPKPKPLVAPLPPPAPTAPGGGLVSRMKHLQVGPVTPKPGSRLIEKKYKTRT